MTRFRAVCSLLCVMVAVQLTNNAAVDPFRSKIKQSSDDVVGLYSVKDDVEILTIHNFKSEVYGSKRVWFVEFYNSYCGFCQRFAPSWKEFATNVKDWKDLIAIGAIDCSNEENYPLCRDMEIMGYPTLKYFHEEYVEAPQSYGQNLRAGSGAQEHKEKLLGQLVKEQLENRGKTLPNLLPYVQPTTDSLLNELPAKYTILLIQEPASYIGEALILDLHKTPNTKFAYAFNNNTELLNTLGVTSVPAVVLFDENKQKQELSILEDPKNTIVQFLESKNVYHQDNELNKDAVNVKQAAEIDPVQEKVRKMGDVVFQKDLETALRYSLKKEVARTKDISGEELQALKTYLDVLIKYFPFGKYGQAFLLDIQQTVNDAGDTLHGVDIFRKVKEAEKEERQVFSSPEGWVACKGSSPTFRGYPCGLWTLFHYLTVNHADKHMENKDANPREVLEAMHGYIKNFFGCSDCSQHFQQMAIELEMNKVDDMANSVLWLWKAHNVVNNRLSGDATEDPQSPKVQYPITSRCSDCHHDDDSWDTAEVLKYLKHVYGAINVRYIGSDTRILHLGLDGSNVPVGSSTFFQTVDTSMFFIIYIVSFGIIIFLIRVFMKRGYRKKAYVHDLLGKV